MAMIDPKVEDYTHDTTRPESTVLQELAAETRRAMKHHGMLCGRVESRLLRLLVQLTGARSVLEIGTFTGYSALAMAEAMPEGGRLVTCDIDPESTALARRHWARSPHGAKIDLRLAPALQTIATLPGPFDLVFIDADKPAYPDYYEAVVPKVRPGGLIALDNTLWHGAVVDPQEDTARIIDRLNRRIAADPRVENVLLTVRDGVHLARVI